MELTQSQLAERVGVATSYICEIEGGKVSGASFGLMVKLALVLGISGGPLMEAAVSEDPQFTEFRLEYLRRRQQEVSSKASHLQQESEALAYELRVLGERVRKDPKGSA